MSFETVEISGSGALQLLEANRADYPRTGEYPFLIGDAEELERIRGAAEYNKAEFEEIVRAARNFDVAAWIGERRREFEEYEFSAEETLGEWPGEISEKGKISLHRNILNGKIKKTVFLGFAKITEPWHLPAVLKYGGWNDCPEPTIHCAMQRHWFTTYGSEIVGMSGDVIECVVKNPPRTQQQAIELAWEQYWYCTDIVEQGCGTVANLAATLINSDYWYFWWD